MSAHKKIIEHFQRRLNAAISRSPLLKAYVSRTGRLMDCSRLRLASEAFPRRLLLSVIEGKSPMAVNLAPRSTRRTGRGRAGQTDQQSSLLAEEEDAERERECALVYEALNKRMRRHAELARRETGVHALWFGYPLLFVATREEDSEQHILAPVFMWPISVEPDLRREWCMTIGQAKGDVGPRYNLAMVTWIRRRLDFDVPVPDEQELAELDWEAVKSLLAELAAQFSRSPSVDCEAPLETVPSARNLRPQDSPRIYNSAVLGYFRWQNEAILADLEAIRAKEEIGRVVGGFVSGANLPEPQQVPPPSEDDRYLVHDADFSQEQVVWRSRCEPGLVVHGPPGTGKSQTIVNIIADALAHDRTVLMVCQKQAATRVVMARLKAAGLDELCAEVHDAESDRLGVFRSVRAQVETIPRQARHWDDTRRTAFARDIEALERELDDFASALRLKHPQIGLPYREVRAIEGRCYARFPSVRSIPAIQGIAGAMSAEQLQEANKRIGTIGRLFRVSDAPRNPWRLRHPGVQPSAALGDDLADVVSRMRGFDARHQEIAKNTGAGRILPSDLREVTDSVPEVAERMRSLASKQGQLDSEIALRLVCVFAGRDAKALEKHFALCRTAVALASEVKESPLENRWHSLCHGFSASDIEWTGEQADIVLSYRGKWWPSLRSRFRRARESLLELAPETPRREVWEMAKGLSDYVRARSLRKELRETNTKLVSGKHPVLQDEDQQTAFPSVVLGALGEATWVVERGRGSAWLNGALLDVGNGRSAAKVAQDLFASLKRVPVVADLFGVLPELSPYLKESAFHVPRELALAGKPIGGWLDALVDGYVKLDSLTAYEYDRSDRSGEVGALLNALDEYEPARMRGERLPEPPLRLPPEEYGQWWVTLTEYAASLAWQDRCHRDRPVLARMTPDLHAAKVKQLRSLLASKRELESQAIVARWRNKQVEHRREPWNRMFQLKKSKYGKAMRLREAVDLSHNAGLFSLRPCWLTNPASAAQVFPLAEELFDLVIFDEASQCPVEQAIPAIYRGRVLVVAGDGKQLPPTSFFSAHWSADFDTEGEEAEQEEDASDDPIEDRARRLARIGEDYLMETEDLLEVAVDKLPERYLSVHYRSEHPALIEFSNQTFYEGRLEAPPAKEGNHVQPPPIRYHEVGGTYASRTNRDEAKEVVRLLTEIWLDTAQPPTVGVVTFNQPQKDLIVDLLEEECHRNPALARRYQEQLARKEGNQDVGFFVKNLENVQGDERDVMVFSTTFGRDEEGRFYRRFGPVGAKGGERRLNVAITRAKKQVHVVTSMPLEEISEFLQGRDLPGTRFTPAACLQMYLAYARAVSESNGDAVADILARLGAKPTSCMLTGSPESPFEEEVHSFLCDQGYEVDCQVGDSGFRIDMAVRHPEPERGYVLGIECDGAAYHSDRSARLRDVWREEILRKRGWDFHRIWSTRWWSYRREESQRLVQVIEEALAANP